MQVVTRAVERVAEKRVRTLYIDKAVADATSSNSSQVS